MNNDIDLSAIETRPMNKLAVLRVSARSAVAARDAIVDPFSQEWREAHEEAIAACMLMNAELARISMAAKPDHDAADTQPIICPSFVDDDAAFVRAATRRRQIRATRQNVERLREAYRAGWAVGPELSHEERQLVAMEVAHWQAD